MFIYSDNEGPFKGHFDPSRIDPNKQYLKHYENLLTLEFFYKSPRDLKERFQLEKELEICRRKLKYWERHPNYDKEVILKGITQLKRQWR